MDCLNIYIYNDKQYKLITNNSRKSIENYINIKYEKPNRKQYYH